MKSPRLRWPWAEWPDRYEFEMGWAAFSNLLGIGYLVAVPAAAVKNFMPGWVVVVWALALFMGGTAQIIGMQVYLRRPIPGLITERAGLIAQASALIILGGAAWYAYVHPVPPTADPRPMPFLSTVLIVVWLAINGRRDRRIASEFRRRTTPPIAPSVALPPREE